MDILSYILGKKNSGSNTGGSGGTGGSGSSNASVVVKGSAVVDPAQTYSRLYFNTALSNEEVMALMNNLELNYQGNTNILYLTDQYDMVMAMMMADAGVYALAVQSCGVLFAINGETVDPSITFTGWNPDIDFSNGIEIIGNTIGAELPMEGGTVPIGVDNDKIAELFSSEPIKKSINKGLSGVYDGNDIEVGSTHIDVSSLLDENKLPLNINVVDNNLIPRNIVEGVNILGVEGTYSASGGLENELIARTLTTYTNNRVTSVGEYAFYNHKNLTTANFSNVTSIGQYAFQDCPMLKSISFPKVTNIGQYAFYKCNKLTNADFPEAISIGKLTFYTCSNLTATNFPNVTNIGDSAFEYCSNLTNVDFPETTSIGVRAFGDCDKLMSINLPKVTDLKQSAFAYCSSLTNVYFPEATNIAQFAFIGCKKLTSVELLKVTSSISKNAFADCSSLTNVNIPNATDIGERAFQNCASLTSINFPEATNIGDLSFYGCASLKSVELPKTTYIRGQTFQGCSRLTSVELPNVISIGVDAFAQCYSLTKVFIAQAEQICTLGQRDAFSNCYHILGTTNKTYNPNGLKDGYIYVPASLLSQYKVATNWSAVASQIIGHEDLEAGATLPNYTTTDFTIQTWYSDEKLTTVVTEVTAAGKYYCRLEA